LFWGATHKYRPIQRFGTGQLKGLVIFLIICSSVKPQLLKKGLMLRSVVVDALGRLMRPSETAFRMRDASVGYRAEAGEEVSASQVNAAIQKSNE